MIPADLHGWMEWIKLGWAALQTIVVGAIALHLWIVDRQRIRRDALDRLRDDLVEQIVSHRNSHEARLDQHHDRLAAVEAYQSAHPPAAECHARLAQIARIEQRLEGVPTAEHVRDGDSRAHARIDTLATGLAELKGGIARIERSLDMLSQHMLDRARP